MKFLLFSTAMAGIIGTGQQSQSKGYYPTQTFISKFEEASIVNTTIGLAGIKEFAKKSLLSHIFVSSDTVVAKDNSYCSREICYVYFDHVINNKTVSNHQAAVSIDYGKLHTMYFNFANEPEIAKCQGDSIQEGELIFKVQQELNATYNFKGTKSVYYETETGLVSGLAFQLNSEQAGSIDVVVEDCKGELVDVFYLTLN